MVCPEEKSVRWMEHLVDRFSKSGDLVVNRPSGTISTSWVCAELPPHRRFIGCRVHSCFSAASKKALVKAFSRKIINENMDISGTDEVADAGKTVVQPLDAMSPKNQMRLVCVAVWLFSA